MKKVVRGNTFCGNPISEYGQQNRHVDYATLAKAFDAVLCNEIMNVYSDHWEIVNGSDYDEENDEYTEIYQYYIISGSGAKVLEHWTDEIVYYNGRLDMYVWGVTHFGTSWDYVLTDIEIAPTNEEIVKYYDEVKFYDSNFVDGGTWYE